jgi:hypothetical protein
VKKYGRKASIMGAATPIKQWSIETLNPRMCLMPEIFEEKIKEFILEDFKELLN